MRKFNRMFESAHATFLADTLVFQLPALDSWMSRSTFSSLWTVSKFAEDWMNFVAFHSKLTASSFLKYAFRFDFFFILFSFASMFLLLDGPFCLPTGFFSTFLLWTCGGSIKFQFVCLVSQLLCQPQNTVDFFHNKCLKVGNSVNVKTSICFSFFENVIFSSQKQSKIINSFQEFNNFLTIFVIVSSSITKQLSALMASSLLCSI